MLNCWISGGNGTTSYSGSALPHRTWKPWTSRFSPCSATCSARRGRSRGWRTTRCWSCSTRRRSTTCSPRATLARSQTTSCSEESRSKPKNGPFKRALTMCSGEAWDWTLRHGSSYTGVLSTEPCKFTSWMSLVSVMMQKSGFPYQFWFGYTFWKANFKYCLVKVGAV